MMSSPNTCKSSPSQLKYSLTPDTRDIKNAIWGATKSITCCVMEGATEIRPHMTPFNPVLFGFKTPC